MRLMLGGAVIAETTANIFRPDLKNNGLGDGHYGFCFLDVAGTDLSVQFIDEKLEVHASIGESASVRGEPAAGLRLRVEIEIRTRALDENRYTTIVELIDSIDRAKCVSAVYALAMINWLNAARAHFPDWKSSLAFLNIAIELATASGSHHSKKFYVDRLRRQNAPQDNAPRVLVHTDLTRYPVCYGSVGEIAESYPNIHMEIVKPLFLGGGHYESFMQEAGILNNGPEGEDSCPVLAYREYAFGEPSWWVNRQGQRSAVSRHLYYMDFEMLRSVLDRGGFLIIDMSNEGPAPEPFWINLLNANLEELDISANQLIFVTQNLRFGRTEGANRICGDVAHAHFFISRSIQILKERYTTDSQIAEHCATLLSKREKTSDERLKHYICLNFTPRWSRWATVLHLSVNGWLERGHVSFPGGTNHKMKQMVDLEKVFPALNGREILLRHAEQFINKCPMRLDVAGPPTLTPVYEFPLELMSNSLLHIVTESEMSDGKSVERITEKILKPIVGLQPFLIAGNPRSLELLKSMGFRTFGFIIDENYDLISDPALRLDAVLAQVDKLVGLPIEALRELMDECRSVVIHNFVHLLRIGPMIFNHAVELRLKKMISKKMPAIGISAGVTLLHS